MSDPINDPWEKWVLKKAIELQQIRCQREGEIKLFKQQEQLHSEAEKKRDKKNEEVYSKWLLEKRRKFERKAVERERLEYAACLETERREKLKEAKCRDKFRAWVSSKEETEKLASDDKKRAEETKDEIKRGARLKAAEAYELWLIEHPFKLFPKPSFVNPQAWDDNTD